MRTPPLPALLSLCLLALGSCAPPAPEAPDALEGAVPPAPRRVFLITVDTLRADHLSLYGYPRATSPGLEALAATGVAFDHAIAQWPKTGTSFASMFTGRYPQTTGLTHAAAVRIPDSYLTLPELFHQQGYTTAGVVSNAVLSRDLGWNAGFDEFLQTWGDGFSEEPTIFREQLWAGKVNELALPLLERHAKDERLFVWLHYSDPHAPYLLPEGSANPFLGDALYAPGEEVELKGTRGKAIGDHRDLGFYVAQYDANILVVDQHIEQLLARADELGLLEDALIVFAADHGEALGEHDSYFEHGPTPYNHTAHVPLFFVYPGAFAAGRRVAPAVEMVDLYPTLSQLLAPRQPPEGLEGHSLLPWLLPPQPAPETVADLRYAFSEAGRAPSHYRSVQDADWKLIFRPETQQKRQLLPETLELYDLRQDPGETTNVLAAHTEEVRRLRRELLGWMKDVTAGSDEQSDEAQRALRALGYAN